MSQEGKNFDPLVQDKGRVFKFRSFSSANALLAYLAIADFIFHMVVATNYGYFRDELYYIVS